MRFFRPFPFARFFYPGAVFRLSAGEKSLFLTFDDGPDPSSTPSVLDTLDSCGIKAMFFCLGENAYNHPELINEMKKRGHVVGNHGYSHINGFKVSSVIYAENARSANEFTSSQFFRPPYGLITPRQFWILSKSYKIFFWDVLAHDFNKREEPAELLMRLKGKTRSGSVIVFHDKKESLVNQVLSDFIEHFLEKGYSFSLPL